MMIPKIASLALLCVSGGLTSVSASSPSSVRGRAVSKRSTTTTTVELDGVAYYLHPVSQPQTPIDTLDIFTPTPCTVFATDQHPQNASSLAALLATFASTDDVWSPAFQHCVVVQSTDPAVDIADIAPVFVGDGGVDEIYMRHVSSEENTEVPNGPYFVHGGRLFEAWRMYPDTAAAFMVASVPDLDAEDQYTFKALDAAAYGATNPAALTVAVPSRLYFSKTPDKPYAGLRVAVKDLYHVAGLTTTGSSRAYAALYGPQNTTAETMRKMIDLGFVLVGKTVTTQFGDSEWPTRDYVDYHGPFNPRGDGYLTPSGSSSGSASAVATYEWLDYALGTDTLGSIRSPAAVQGLYSMRPSPGAASQQGVIPYSSLFDTIGAFAKTAREFLTLTEALYSTPKTIGSPFKKPTRLLVPTDYLPGPDAASNAVFEGFVSRLERYLGVERTAISLGETWHRHGPEAVRHMSLQERFEYAFDWAANFDQWRLLFVPFLADYNARFGKDPVLNPELRFKKEYDRTVTAENQTEAIALLAEYRQWFYSHVMPPATDDGNTDAIMVLPWSNGVPVYRDEYASSEQRFTGAGFFFYNVGPYAHAPEILIPVGSTKYTSKYTGRAEDLPAAMSIVGAKGSDLAIARLVDELMAGEPREGGHGTSGFVDVGGSRNRLEL